MGFKKIRLGVEEIFETRIQDETGREVGRWKALKSDYPNVVRILNNKFGLGIKVIKIKEKDKDLDWAR